MLPAIIIIIFWHVKYKWEKKLTTKIKIGPKVHQLDRQYSQPPPPKNCSYYYYFFFSLLLLFLLINSIRYEGLDKTPPTPFFHRSTAFGSQDHNGQCLYTTFANYTILSFIFRSRPRCVYTCLDVGRSNSTDIHYTAHRPVQTF